MLITYSNFYEIVFYHLIFWQYFQASMYGRFLLSFCVNCKNQNNVFSFLNMCYFLADKIKTTPFARHFILT